MGQVEDFLAGYSPEIQTISQQLRTIIKNAIPEAAEKVYLGWRGVGYRHPVAGYFCCIFPFGDRVNLAFEHGVLLPDPDQLLKKPPTSSKQVRYLELHTEQDIQEDELVALLHAAIMVRP